MNESEFSQCCDEIMLAIEEVLDNSDADIDYETSAGVLTLTIEENASKVIVSRQPALSQIWLAAKSGGYYFNYSDDNWVCTATQESLGELLQRVCKEQQAGDITFEV